MIRKYFSFDKNYILKKAQHDLKKKLISHTIATSKSYYLTHHNPLGIEDKAVRRIKNHRTTYIDRLDEFYQNLAAIYRFQHEGNQLELLFDGRSHYDKYAQEWEESFNDWISQFCERSNFLRAVLELTVFYPEGRKSALAENRMKAFIHQHFELKVYKHKGIVRQMVS